jgi:hypothetical protein
MIVGRVAFVRCRVANRPGLVAAGRQGTDRHATSPGVDRRRARPRPIARPAASMPGPRCDARDGIGLTVTVRSALAQIRFVSARTLHRPKCC